MMWTQLYFMKKNCISMEIILFFLAAHIVLRRLFSEAADTDAIRLAGSKHEDRGRVEIYHSGQWGTICDDLWDDIDASVVCRSLGFREGVAYSRARYGLGIGPIWMDDVNCGPNEKAIQNCKHRGWGIANCDHNEDAGVRCFGTNKDTITKMEMALTMTISIGLVVFVSGLVFMGIIMKRKGCTVTLRCCIDVHNNTPSEAGHLEAVKSHQDITETNNGRRVEPLPSDDYEIVSCEFSTTTRRYQELDKRKIETVSPGTYTNLPVDSFGSVGNLRLSQESSTHYEEIPLKSITLK